MATLPDERIHSPFIIDVQGQGNSTMIYVKASSNIQAGADFKISVTSPENVVTSKSLTFSQGEYFASFATDAPGKYSVHLEYIMKRTPISRYLTMRNTTASQRSASHIFTGF